MKAISPTVHDFLAGRPAVLELDQAALEIARLHDPGLDSAAALRILDEWAEAIGSALPAGAGGAQYLTAAHRFLFGQMGLHGGKGDFFEPENSCLHLALERRRGLPITLAVIYMEIARRLLRPVYGIALPGHFVCQYNDGLLNVFVDVFNGGRLMLPADAAALVEAATGQRGALMPETLAPATPARILLRMLKNLRNAYARRGDETGLRHVDQYLALASPSVFPLNVR